MKYLLLAVLTILHFSAFSQGPQLIQQFNADSTLMATGVVAKNQREGLWKFFNPKTNVLLVEGNFAAGKREGTWSKFYSNGKRAETAEYRNGKLFGPALYFDSEGALKRQMIFQDSVLVGKYIEYFGKAGNPDYINPAQVMVEGQYEKGKRTGQWVSFYEFGELATREFYVDGLREGPYLEYDPGGEVITEALYVKGQFEGSFKRLAFGLPLEIGTYRNGKKVGEWKRYFAGTKVLEAEEYYDQNGNKTGEWKYYYESGRLARVEKYKNNIGVGVWEEYFPNKALSKRKTYELGVPVGEYIEYHSSGKPSVQGQYQNGAKTGIWKSYFPDGELYSIGEYRNDLKSGLWKFFNKIGILVAEGEYSLGMEVGQWVYYYDGGQLKSVGSYKLGLEDGIWGLFYDNKQLTQEEFWENGRLKNVGDCFSYDGQRKLEKGTLKDGNGTRITYYINGQKESEGTFKSGKAEGLWIFYHENGRKASEGSMKDGKKEGPWRYYNSAGRLEDLINFKNDVIVPSN
jgi:uncharacterized protein